jgi:hypothetical protein
MNLKLIFNRIVLVSIGCIYFSAVHSQTQIGLDIDGEAARDRSGLTVSSSSDSSIVAIGAYLNDGNGINSGQVRVYKYVSGTWTQIGSDIDGEAAGDESGWAVSLSSNGSTVAIGAMYNAGNGTDAGQVRVYENISGTWTQVGSDIDGEAAGDYSGRSVSLSSDGSTVAIGANLNDGNGTDAGQVRVYENISGTWTQVGSDIDGEAANDESGYSVSLSSDGSTVAIGAVFNDANGTNSGHVRIYKNISGTWTQVGSDIDGEAAGDYSGRSVSLSSDGSTVAIGAKLNDGNGTDAGHVRVYENVSGTWTQMGSDIDGEAAGDHSGGSVSLSSDGSTVAIGGHRNNGNGTDAGHVRIYKSLSGTWTQKGSDIDGEAAGDYSGRSLSLSSDGSTVAIGAKFNDGNGADAGHVRVYSVCFTSTSTDTISECQSYTWTNGVTYTSSDTIAKDTFVNAAGCDSIVTLNLTINYASTSTDSISSCVSYTWTNGVTYTSSDTIAKDTFVNAAGCDSIVTLNLIILNPSSDTLNISECYSYTSSSGNTWTSSGIYFDTLTNAAGCDSVITFNLTIGDTILPTVITSNLTVYLDTSGAASITSTDIDSNSFDNCGISSLFLDITSFDCNDIGANTVTLTATDVYSNVDSATAVVIVLDTIRPTVLTNNLTVYLDSSGTASISTADIDSSSFDNCSITSYTLSDSTFDCNETGANTIWLSITDRYGNIDSATAIVTVVDTITTTLLTNNLTVYLDTSGAASITTTDIDSNSFDNCSITLSLDIFNFDCNDVGANTVILTATDVSGNVDSATAVVTVVDTIRPTVLTNNPTVYLDASGAASITTTDIDSNSFDNCGISSLFLDITSFDCNDVGTNTVKLTATDVNGNVDSATSVVIVVDTIRSTVLTNNTMVYLDASGAASITTNDINNSSFDNCGIISLSLDATSFSCNDVGANAVTLTATDVNGNVDAATAVVTVVDTIKPTVLTNNLPIYLNASGTASISNNDINNSSFDNCGISSLSLDITSFDCNDVGANTVVLTATDVNSNSRSATAIVIVLDTISPVILTVPNDITLGYCDALYTYSAPTASDNCSFTIAQIAGLSSGSKFPIGTTTNTFVVTDASGNQDVTSFDVTIIQEYLPFVLSDLSYCGNSTQVNLSQGRDSITFAGIGVGSNAISFEPVIAGVGTHTITATFIDTMGCVTNGTFDIQVLEAPTVPNITRVASDKIRVDQEYESYQWYRNGTIIEGERAQLYRAMELGLYTVLTENGNKCYEISEGYEFGIPFQEDEVIQQNRVTVYPNPTEGLVFIEFKNGEDTHIVTLTNGLGVELIKVNTDQRVYRLDISNLAAGTYTVNVVSSTINESVQIIKK